MEYFHDQNEEKPSSISFSDFPEDIQLCILSFLTPSEISAFACSSKRFASLCHSDTKLWYFLCDRRWGGKTQIKKWGNGQIRYRLLYKTLQDWSNLIGFWRRSGHGRNQDGAVSSPHLIFFEWGPSFITGSRVSPSEEGTYDVNKSPFIWLSLTPHGEVASFLDPVGRKEVFGDFEKLGFRESDLVPINVNFMGKNHVVVEENVGYYCVNSEEKQQGYSLLGNFMSEIYQYFANRTSPGIDRAARRQRRRERQRRKWEPEHFVKIVNSSPTPSRPLQGLWKGIREDTKLEFYLVMYDDIGGISCRKVGDSSKPFSGSSPVFWASNTECLESPLPPEEEYIYGSRAHFKPSDHLRRRPLVPGDDEAVSRVLFINSSYDLVLADLAGAVNPCQVEGRIWQYGDGTFGFGFLRDDFIVDLKHIARNDRLLDVDSGEIYDCRVLSFNI